MEFRELQGISFEEAERRHAELKRSYDAGQLGEEEFDAERQRLVVVDDEGRAWAISREGDRWLYHDGGNAWIEATPPSGPPASPWRPSPDGEGVTLEKSPPQDTPERPAGQDAASAPRRGTEDAAGPATGTSPGERRRSGKKAAPLLLLALAAGFVVVAVAGLLGYLLWPVEAPALEGRMLEAAREEFGQDFELVSSERDSGEPKGTIVSQEPAAGMGVGRGGEISVVVSTGMATLPDVLGMDEDDAEDALRDMGFEVETRTREGYAEDVGRVVDQSPSGGDEPEAGATVSIVVGEAPPVPEDVTLKLTIPKMAQIKDDTIPYTTGDDEDALHDNAGIRLDGTGHPWGEEANVYITGHRLGYPNTDSWLAFWDLDKLENGDEVIITDANGTEYTYEVFREFVVAPTDLWVTEPIEGKNIVTLQTCTLPEYADRLVVQAELTVESGGAETTTAEAARVPDVVGRSKAEAERALRAAGFEAEAHYREGPEREVGKVVEQIPSGGGEADKSVPAVIVMVDSGPPPEEQFTLPATGGSAP